MQIASKRPLSVGAITLVVASSWSSSAALASCAATALSASAGVFGPPSISATESSTAQALELIRQRRVQVAEACPTGFTRSGGICQPVAQAAAEPVAAPAPAPVAAAEPAPAAGGAGAGSSAAPSARAKAAPRPRTTVASAAPATRAPTRASAPAAAPVYGGGGLKDYGFGAPAPARMIGSWLEGYADWEKHDDVRPDRVGNQTRESYSTGLLAGLDATDVPRGIQLGILGGYNYTQAKFSPTFGPRRENDDGNVVDDALTFNAKTAIEGTSIGLYGSYFENTGFSADLLYKVDLYDLTQAESIASEGGCGNIRIFHNHGETSLTNHIVASNFNYRWELGGGRWIEPTVGLRYTHTSMGGNAVNLGLDDGDALRVQGGLRLGQVWSGPGNSVITTRLTGLLYSDVLVDGFVLPGLGTPAGIAEIDEGKLRVMGIAEAKIDLQNGATWYGQVDVRGGEDLIGVGGKVGVRMRW